MKKIREGLFETNSSSTHSIVVKFKKYQNVSSEKLRISGDTCIIYGIDQSDLYPLVLGEKHKLDYIFTWMYIRDDGQLAYKRWDEDTGDDNPDRKDLWWHPENDEPIIETGIYENQYNNILQAIKRKYPEIERFCFKDAYNSSFDHQTSPYEEASIINLNDVDEIYNYLFNDHLIIELGHD